MKFKERIDGEVSLKFKDEFKDKLRVVSSEGSLYLAINGGTIIAMPRAESRKFAKAILKETRKT